MEKIMHFVKNYHLTSNKGIFYVITVCGVVSFFISGLISRGHSYTNLFQNNSSDYFMDFYNPLSELLNGPYAHGSIYPPLPALFYKYMLRMVPFNVASHGAFAIRSSQAGEMVFFFYLLITILAFFILVMEMKKGSHLEKYLFSFIMLFSGPFLFQFERGNIIFVALLFLMLFIWLKDSNKTIVREIALLSLALAAAIKIYPILFIILLLKEKRFIETLRVVIYGAILFFFPFFALGGLTQLPVFLKNITTSSNDALVWGVGYSVNIQSAVRIIGATGGNFGSMPIFIGHIISYIVLVLGILAAFFIRSLWRTVALLTLLMILVPALSFEYSLIFMIIPLIMFLDTDEKKLKMSRFYLFCFILLFIPFTFGEVTMINSGFGINARPLTYGVLVQNIVLLMMNFFIMAQGIHEMMIKISNRRAN
jgi:Glycosyltransferase family 87